MRAHLWVPSHWVALLSVAAVGVTALLVFLLSAEPDLTPEQRTAQAEYEQATGTGAASYDRVLALLSHCHDSIRKRFAGKAELTIDGGLVPTRSYIYTYVLRGIRFVRVAASEREVSSESVGAAIGSLMPPIQGGFIVEGLVIYSGDHPAVSYRDYREYHCSMLVTGDRFEVRDLRINPIR